jgi:RNA polymerase sigma-70 factor (ECF subfamily)
MDSRATEARWKRLIELLTPIHGQALTTARRLSRSNDEGNDLYQDAVLRAFQRLDGLRDESRFRSWFFTVLLSRHRSRIRRVSREAVRLSSLGPAGEPVAEGGSDRDEERWRAERVARALAKLAPVEREAVVLFEIEGFSIAETAEVQGVSVAAVKSRLARGREKLRRFYLRLAEHGAALHRNQAPADRDCRPLPARGESS